MQTAPSAASRKLRALTFDCPINHRTYKTGSYRKALGTETGFDQYSYDCGQVPRPSEFGKKTAITWGLKVLSNTWPRRFLGRSGTPFERSRPSVQSGVLHLCPKRRRLAP